MDTLVSVAKRMILNQPPKDGGVGKVIAICHDKRTIDVKYSLGGREKNVEWKYVTVVDLHHTSKRQRKERTLLDPSEDPDNKRKRNKKNNNAGKGQLTQTKLKKIKKEPLETKKQDIAAKDVALPEFSSSDAAVLPVTIWDDGPIGMRVANHGDDLTRVIHVVPDGPAARAGILSGDAVCRPAFGVPGPPLPLPFSDFAALAGSGARPLRFDVCRPKDPRAGSPAPSGPGAAVTPDGGPKEEETSSRLDDWSFDGQMDHLLEESQELPLTPLLAAPPAPAAYQVLSIEFSGEEPLGLNVIPCAKPKWYRGTIHPGTDMCHVHSTIPNSQGDKAGVRPLDLLCFHNSQGTVTVPYAFFCHEQDRGFRREATAFDFVRGGEVALRAAAATGSREGLIRKVSKGRKGPKISMPKSQSPRPPFHTRCSVIPVKFLRHMNIGLEVEQHQVPSWFDGTLPANHLACTVTAVDEDSQAEQQGVRVGDIVANYNSQGRDLMPFALFKRRYRFQGAPAHHAYARFLFVRQGEGEGEGGEGGAQEEVAQEGGVQQEGEQQEGAPEYVEESHGIEAGGNFSELSPLSPTRSVLTETGEGREAGSMESLNVPTIPPLGAQL